MTRIILAIRLYWLSPFLLLGHPEFSKAQVHLQINITSLPAKPAAGIKLYAAGSFNNWDPQNTNYQFRKNERGNYTIDLLLAPGNYEYKITRGSWEHTECKMNGSPMGNRMIRMNRDTAIDAAIEEWSDNLPQQPRESTASAQVHIIDTAFQIPQLLRQRRVWIYLPGDYDLAAKKKYPVLYMHDGQNLFDDLTSFSGEWGVDEFLDSTHLRSCIVVGIDNGGTKRMNEYNPYDNDRFGKGEGDAYVNFLVNTLKPFIDQHYRTLKDKKNTLVAGSSMGGLISLYAVLKYPEVFGGVGVFSPAFWVGPQIFDEIQLKGKQVRSKIYFYGGGDEGETMIPDMRKAYDLLQKLSSSKLTIVENKEGKHNEGAWRKEFPGFYKTVLNLEF